MFTIYFISQKLEYVIWFTVKYKNVFVTFGLHTYLLMCQVNQTYKSTVTKTSALATHYETMKILFPISEELIAEWTPVAPIQQLFPVSSRHSDSSFQTMMWAVCIFPTLPQMERWDDSLVGFPKLERWTYICVNNHPGAARGATKCKRNAKPNVCFWSLFLKRALM